MAVSSLAGASAADRWLHALKPASWPKLLVPAAFGHAVGVAVVGSFSLAGLLAGLAFTVLDLVFIVLLNDWGDREVDAIKRRMFPDGCSPKTIPDGILSSRAVGVAGAAAGLGALLTAAGFGGLLERRALLPGAAVALAVFVAYTLPPLRLNYRGGGEVLEAVGVGAVLPWINFHAQSGEIWHASLLALLPGFVLLSLGSAVASGLSDERSDRTGGKTTVVTALGNVAARRLVERLLVAGAVAWVFCAVALATAHLVALSIAAAAGVGSLVVVAHLVPVGRVSGAAVTDAFAAQAAYKLQLHRAIWLGGLVVGAVAAAGAVIG